MITLRKSHCVCLLLLPVIYCIWMCYMAVRCLPAFRAIFADFKLDLPLITIRLFATYRYWFLVPTVLAVSIVDFARRKEPSSTYAAAILFGGCFAGIVMNAWLEAGTRWPMTVLIESLTK